MTPDELKLSEHENLYPPRFVVKISAAGDCKAIFTFEGATDEIESEVLLKEGMVN